MSDKKSDFPKKQKEFDKKWDNLITHISAEEESENISPNLSETITLPGPRDYSTIHIENEEEIYSPEEESAFQGNSKIITVSIVTIIISLICFIVLALFFQNINPIFFGIILITIISSTAILFIKMPQNRESDNDGAVI